QRAAGRDDGGQEGPALAFSGEGGTFLPPIISTSCSLLMRLRTLSCATMSAPKPAMASLEPVWSPCQWVLKTKRSGLGEILATAALILGASGANSSSMTNTPSS